MIYYSKFSEQQVFSDPRLNVFVNQVFTFLINRMDEATVVNNLIVDGAIAKLLQGESVVDAILKIEFSIQLKSVFDALAVSLASLDVSLSVIEEDKILVQNNDVFFEFILLDEELELFDYLGIKLHKTKIK